MGKTCFIISSIGEKGGEVRELADEKFDLVFEPVLKEAGFYEVIRADKIGTPNSISYDIVTHIINSELVIADVSDLNPNVFYELAIRNAIQKPVIVIKAEGQKMPFDIYDKRAISLDMSLARQWTDAKKELREQIENVKKDPESASKSILTDFSGFQINTNGIKSDVNLELKDLKSEIRRIYDEVRRPRSSFDFGGGVVGVGGSGGGRGSVGIAGSGGSGVYPTVNEEALRLRREKRKNDILDLMRDEFNKGKKFVERDKLMVKISQKLHFPRITSMRYVSMLINEGQIIESEEGLSLVDA